MADKKTTEEPAPKKHDPFGPTTTPANVNPETGFEKGGRTDQLVKDLKEMGAR